MKKTGIKPSPYRLARPVPDANNAQSKPGQSSDQYAANRPRPVILTPPVGLKGNQK